ncbi:MAG: hypothetical protein P8J59_08480 [Phycisphaerales bacterium]|nr:hypothetical protein [Phycisphaerales bacterium]
MRSFRLRHRVPFGRWLLCGTMGVFAGAGLNFSLGCATSGPPKPVVVNQSSPESLLFSLKTAAQQSFNRYLTALKSVTDCERMPEVCRLLEARNQAATEMVELRDAMASRFGTEGKQAGTIMLRSAYVEQFEEIERASVYSNDGDLAILRIGTEVYRMRRQPTGWRIVQFPDPPYDPATSADAIEILVTRINAIREDVLAGRVDDMNQLQTRIAAAMGG